MDRVFLDANVLFSAAYKPGSRLLVFWERREVHLLSSAYAIEEARRNLALARPHRLVELERLVKPLLVAPQPLAELDLPEAADLAEKDRPILAAAIAASASHLLTGDKDHFGDLLGRSVGGVRVLTPSAYLRETDHEIGPR